MALKRRAKGGSNSTTNNPGPKKKTKTTSAPSILSAIKKAYDAYNKDDRKVLLAVRDMIYATASTDERIGTLTETLKWGEPAYLTEATGAGSTLRLGYSKLVQGPAMFVSCSTPLLRHLKSLDTEGTLDYFGLRDIAIPQSGEVWTPQQKKMLQTCILETFTYHLNKKKIKKAMENIK